MKVSLIIFGIHHNTNNNSIKYRDYNKIKDIWEKNLNNIFDYTGSFPDIFIDTNSSLYNKDIESFFKPKIIIYDDNDFPQTSNIWNNNKWLIGGKYASRVKKEINSIKSCINYSDLNNIQYDLIIITRFDILFNDRLKTSNIDLNKFNITSILEEKNFICDNLYILPHKYLEKFLNIILKTNEIHHTLKNKFEETFEVNYIKNEYVCISELSFYNLIRGN